MISPLKTNHQDGKFLSHCFAVNIKRWNVTFYNQNEKLSAVKAQLTQEEEWYKWKRVIVFYSCSFFISVIT